MNKVSVPPTVERLWAVFILKHKELCTFATDEDYQVHFDFRFYF